ncbi:MAG TPA: rhomboid family intramembrane serine protease [Rhizomicrobium sp.]|jgi:membrane associated rhomboid family serine protease|nr:rhomboid family intramembrane serine protease [Rhizomicrobium sp.]
MREKFRAVFLPVILLAVGLALILALLNGLALEIVWLPLDEDVAAIWLPVLLAIVIVALWIEPRIRLLALNKKRNINALYVLVAFAAIAGPAILVQEYVQARIGAMVQIESPSEVAAHPQARYFTVSALCLDVGHAVAHTRVATSGDHDEDMNITVYVAVPFCAARAGTAWLGTIFSTRIDNRLGDKQKDAAYRAFLERSQHALNTADPHLYRYLERVGFNADRRGFLKALADYKIAAPGAVFLAPHTTPFVRPGDGFLGGAGLAFLAAAALWALMVFLAPLKPPAERKTDDGPSLAHALFVPTREAFGLPVLLDINLIVYLAMVLSGIGVFDFEIDDLIAWGASSGALDHGFGLIRLLTATFVHAGFFHILGNIYGLLFAAIFLTPVARSLRLVICYVVCGIGGSILSVAVHPDIVAVGASGAIFGLYGVLLTLIVLRDAKLVELTRPILIVVGIFVVVNAINGATTPGIDNFAHLGGFLAGIPCGIMLYALDRREKGYGQPPA